MLTYIVITLAVSGALGVGERLLPQRHAAAEEYLSSLVCSFAPVKRFAVAALLGQDEGPDVSPGARRGHVRESVCRIAAVHAGHIRVC